MARSEEIDLCVSIVLGRTSRSVREEQATRRRRWAIETAPVWFAGHEAKRGDGEVIEGLLMAGIEKT